MVWTLGLPFPQETDGLVVIKLLMPLNLFDHLNMCYSYSYVGHLKLELFCWIFTILLNSSLITCALHVHILYSWETPKWSSAHQPFPTFHSEGAQCFHGRLLSLGSGMNSKILKEPWDIMGRGPRSIAFSCLKKVAEWTLVYGCLW